MTYEFAQTILPYAIVGFGGICIAVGYVAGSMRTFAGLGYGSENLSMILSTLKPCYGNRWQTYYCAPGPYSSFVLWLKGKSPRNPNAR